MRARHWLYTIPLRIRALLLRHRVEQELDDEFQFHFHQQVEAGLARGMTPADAHAEASKGLDRIQLRKEECRDMRGLNFIDNLAQDLRYATRMLRKSPVFTAVAVLALALGIGVNTAVFTAYKAMVARPLDARDPGGMVNLALIRDTGDFTFSYPDYEAYRDSIHSFSGVIAFSHEHMTLSNAGGIVSQRTAAAGSVVGRLGLISPGASNAEFASIYVVSENYFKVLGVAALRGRTFESIRIPDLVASPSVLISENYWQKRFAGDPAVLGKTIHLNGAAVTVVGITPHDFAGTGMAVPDFWLPLSLAPLVHADNNRLRDREIQCCRLFARLASGVSIGQAQAEMTVLADRLRTLHDPHSELAKPATVLVWPGSPFPLPLKLYVGLKLAILLIMAAAGMVLAVACANVASLQLARARSRQNELRTRLSLGASRLRVIRQLLTESALLGLLAGVAALLFTWALLKVSVILAAEAVPAEVGTLIFDVTPDLGIFACVFAISLVAGILSGLAPALESSRSALSSAVRAGTSPVRTRRLQDFFIAAQVALSLVLLIAGSMLIRSAINSLRMETGYDSKHVVDLNFHFPEASKYTAARRVALVHELRTRLAALPGVAAIASARPPDDNDFRTAAVVLDGERSAGQNGQSILHYSFVEASYFQTLSIPLFLGRSFQPQAGQPEHSVILSESAAKQLWPGQNPIGRGLRLGATDERVHNRSELSAGGPAYQVIGVARDTRGVEFDGSDSKQVYLQLPQDRFQSHPILIRTQSGPAQVIRAIDPVISSIDPDLVATSSTLEEMLRRSAPFIVSSFAAAIASTVGLIGLLLASMGIYGTVSYIVVLRTREIGIRMAVGAQERNILRLILRESTRPVIAGLLVGMFLAAGASYLLRGLLYGLNTVDGISFVGVSLLFLAIALLAAYPPSRRAMRVDPTVALRYE
jgi:predicted permease